MRLAWHIFLKDARRLWWEVVVTLGVLAMLAHEDRWRTDFMAGPIEGLLNLVLPAAWAYLVMLLVHQEPLVGDRQFWITRPYPRGSLVPAKAFFVTVFILLPKFFADAAILAFRGFSPLSELGSLLWKQGVLAMALLLPAAALAAITRTGNQFILVSIGLGGVAAMLQRRTPPWIPVDTGRISIVVAVLVAAAVLILFLQYTRRSTRWSQALAVMSGISAVLLFLLLPEETTFRMACVTSGKTYDGLAIRLTSTEGPPPDFTYSDSRRIAVPIPVRVDGLPESTRALFGMLEVDMLSPTGDRWATVTVGTRGAETQQVVGAGLYQRDDGRFWLTLHLAERARSSTRATGVTVRGKFAATLYREGPPVTMSAETNDQPVPGLGICSSSVVEGSRGIGRRMMKVVCESPRPLPVGPRVSLQHRQFQWRNFLGDSSGMFAYPTETPLSPLYRLQTFFHITQVPSGPGVRWVVPAEFLDSTTLSITPREVAGCAVVDFEFRDLDLRRYVAPPMP